ncbi:MAG: hypothetical protein AAFO82_18420 [Bacteroidota bacterium]
MKEEVMQLNTPLNVHQIEILKLFSREMEESDLIAIKRLIVQYLGEKITKRVDQVWEEKAWTNEDFERLLHTHQRTPYNPQN